MRGSTAPYSRFAARFPANTMAEVASAMPTSSGASPPSPAVTAACPRPGYEKTCSTSTDPPTISLTEVNCRVSAGSARLRRPWRSTARRRASPRASAKRMYSLAMTSTVFSRVWSATLATPVRESTRAGSAAWWMRSSSVTLAEEAPMGTENPTGNQPSQTEKTISANMASQNPGVAESR